MYQIYCDGASRSNPGEASIGVSINKNNTEILDVQIIIFRLVLHLLIGLLSS